MTGARDPGREALERALKTARARREQARQAPPPSLWKHLSMVGALGWMIVLPTVLAALLGRWIDHRLGTGIAFSALFILAAVALSAWMAWQRIVTEEADLVAPPPDEAEPSAPERPGGRGSATSPASDGPCDGDDR